MAVDGHAVPRFGDFTVAFWAVAAVSLTATFWNLRFAPDAGHEMSGHTPRSWNARQVIKEPRGLGS
jgi:hypothetical protein